MSSLREVPMRFFEVGCVLLRAKQSPLLLKRTVERPSTGNPLCIFQCLESWREVTYQTSEVIFGCEQHGWEILKRSHPAML